MLEPAASASGQPRALLAVAGMSVARRQVALAGAMECQRVLCIARSLAPGILALQHEAEAAGLRFQVIAGAHQVVSAITAIDEVLVIADGLLVDPAEALRLIGRGPGVVVQPVEPGLALGFERIDLNHAAAGLVRMPGRLVERLGELPADCDAVSALIRIALQAGVPKVELPADLREGAGWKLVRDEAEADALEARLIDRLLGSRHGLAPGFAVARQAVRSFGPALLAAGSRETALAAIGALVLALGLVAGWLGWVAPALVLIGLAWLLRRVAALTGAVAREGGISGASSLPREKLFGMVVDAGLVLVVIWAGPPALPWWERAFAPLALIVALRAMRRWQAGEWKPWLGDRLLACLLLAAAAGAGLLRPAIMVAVLGVLAAAMLARRGPTGPQG